MCVSRCLPIRAGPSTRWRSPNEAGDMGRFGHRKLVLAALAAVVFSGTLLAVSGETGASPIAGILGGTAVRQVTATPGAGQPFDGVAAVGALFTVPGGSLDAHFCTASVVHSA